MAPIGIGHRLNRAIIRQHFLYGTFERFVGHRKCGFDTVADTKLDVLAAELALRLVQCGQLVDDAVIGSQCIDASGFDINTDALLQLFRKYGW